MRWHRTGRDTSDICVVSSASHEEDWLLHLPDQTCFKFNYSDSISLFSNGKNEIPVEDRSDDSEIRKVRSSGARMIREDHVAPRELAFEGFHLELNGLLHGAQVHGYVRSIGNQPAIRSENRTGEVQTLLDIRGDGGPLKNPSRPTRQFIKASNFIGTLLNSFYRSIYLPICSAILMKRWEKILN